MQKELRHPNPRRQRMQEIQADPVQMLGRNPAHGTHEVRVAERATGTATGTATGKTIDSLQARLGLTRAQTSGGQVTLGPDMVTRGRLHLRLKMAPRRMMRPPGRISSWERYREFLTSNNSNSNLTGFRFSIWNQVLERKTWSVRNATCFASCTRTRVPSMRRTLVVRSASRLHMTLWTWHIQMRRNGWTRKTMAIFHRGTGILSIPFLLPIHCMLSIDRVIHLGEMGLRIPLLHPDRPCLRHPHDLRRLSGRHLRNSLTASGCDRCNET